MRDQERFADFPTHRKVKTQFHVQMTATTDGVTEFKTASFQTEEMARDYIRIHSPEWEVVTFDEVRIQGKNVRKYPVRSIA